MDTKLGTSEAALLSYDAGISHATEAVDVAANSQAARPDTPRTENPYNPSSFQKRQLEAQEAFLTAYTKTGTTREAIAVAGIGRTTVYDWDRGDTQGFQQRWEHSRHSFREGQEQDMYALLKKPEGNRGSDVLRMFALKALWPEKYRETAVTGDDNTARDLLDALRGKGRKVKQEGESES